MGGGIGDYESYGNPIGDVGKEKNSWEKGNLRIGRGRSVMVGGEGTLI